MMQKPKLLLTGGSGMVGRNILEHPRAAGWDIAAPSRSELDLTDTQAVGSYVANLRPDLVIHAAGEVGGIQANIQSPVEFLVRNTDIGRNVVMAARAAGIKRLLNLSSSCMYPRDARNPLTEDMVLNGQLEPTNEGYAIAKIFTTRLCQYISQECQDLEYKTLIPCNLYGRYDKFDSQRSHLVPAVIVKIHHAKTQGLSEVYIWGDGTARREFLYAGDLADVIFHALDMFHSLPDLCNIGLGYDHSIDDYYGAVADVIGWSGKFVHDVSRPVGMKRKMVDVSRQAALGWKPRTSLRNGIARTYDFYLNKATR
jgi:GDP-L-fucose synthase